MAQIAIDDANASAGADYAGLLKQRHQLDDQLAALRTRAIDEFKQRVLAEAEELEIDVQALFASERPRRGSARATAEVRYRDPANPDNTWSGRGRPAKWLLDYLDAGRDKDEFVVT